MPGSWQGKSGEQTACLSHICLPISEAFTGILGCRLLISIKRSTSRLQHKVCLQLLQYTFLWQLCFLCYKSILQHQGMVAKCLIEAEIKGQRWYPGCRAGVSESWVLTLQGHGVNRSSLLPAAYLGLTSVTMWEADGACAESLKTSPMLLFTRN